ncbi:hypothetical protein [Haloferula sp.]|uniref:hypothetical protein n=1 Tax=Haloferula sp. TaxID=2497595 RepID=UPI003C732D38
MGRSETERGDRGNFKICALDLRSSGPGNEENEVWRFLRIDGESRVSGMSEEKVSVRRVLIAVFGGLVVLGLMGWVVVQRAVRVNRKPSGQMMASSLASAVENFYGEYNHLPDVGGDRVQTDGPAGEKLLEILLNMEGSLPEAQNVRSVIFLQGKEAKGGKDGIAYTADDSPEGLFDSYGRPYTVILNSDKKDTLKFRYGDQTIRLRGKQAAVWSVGKDGIEGTNDDVKSWN